MSTDTDRLIAQARGRFAYADEPLVMEIADALEAAEALHQGQRAAKMDALTRAEAAEGQLADAEMRWRRLFLERDAAEAQRDTLAKALRYIVGYGVSSRDAAMQFRAVARAALAGVAPPEEQHGE